MQAIVSALDDPHRELIENIWGGLKAVFGFKQLAGATAPHFIYQSAEQYDPQATDTVLARIAAATPAFTITTGVVGVLRGPRCVLYLPVLESDALDRLHATLWHDVAPLAAGVRQAYAAETWAPHITLAVSPINEAQMPRVLRFLEARDTRWALPVTNLCFVPDTASVAVPWRRYALAAAR
jgi:2'-5' RNA ligase